MSINRHIIFDEDMEDPKKLPDALICLHMVCITT